MKKRILFVAAMLMLVPPALAFAVSVSPMSVFMDHRTRTGTMTLYNPNPLPEEIDIAFAFGFVLLVRPLAGAVALVRSPLAARERWMVSIFGIRGMGSFYYLAFALNHGEFDQHLPTCRRNDVGGRRDSKRGLVGVADAILNGGLQVDDVLVRCQKIHRQALLNHGDCSVQIPL